MRRLTIYTLVASVVLSVGLSSAFPTDVVERRTNVTDKWSPATTQDNQPDDDRKFDCGKGVIEFKGVSFTCVGAVASEVIASVSPASMPEGEGAVPPDTIYPEHVVFKLAGTSKRESQSFIDPEIHVYPVADYKRAFSTQYTKEVEETIERLKQLIQKRSATFKGEVPLLPLPSGYLAFRAHTKYLKFKNGAGLAFLTQGQQDEMPINNLNLSYEFQGITDDCLYYVTAEFPVAAPILRDDREYAARDRIKEPACFDCPDYERFKRDYRAYVNRVSRRLEKLSPAKFQPALTSYDSLITSLKIHK